MQHVFIFLLGPSGTNRPPPSPPTRRVIYSSDEDEPERPVWPPRRQRVDSEIEDEDEPQAPRRRMKARRRANPFIETEAGVDGDASEDESDGNDDLDDFIVPDDVEF